MSNLFGGIEAGGTKFVCAVGTGPDDIREQTRFPTTTPEETIGRAIEFFQEQQAAHGELAAIGIASFGPVDPNPQSEKYGYITTTPKPHWADTDLMGRVQQAFDAPVGFDTDVNGAALGEQKWGAAQGLDTFIYMTILLHGLVHPEMGHVLLPHDWEKDPYPGKCPYHGDCLEGMAAGPAIEERWDTKGQNLPEDHPAWDLEAHYLALALHTFICTLSPQRIILGGGVMHQPILFPLIRQKVQESLNGYVQATAVLENIDAYIVPPGLGDRAGVLGAIALGMQAEQ